MAYYEDLRKRISRLTGLTGIEVDHILRGLEKAGVDPEAIDWETLGHEIADKANPYEAAWDWLARNYGISKPVEIGLDRKLKEYREMQEEYEREYEEMEKYLTEEGIREALRKLYSPETPPEEKEEIKEKILFRSKDYEWIPLGIVTKIAIRDGNEQEYAKRFLSEYVKPPEKKVTKKDVYNVLTEEGKTIVEIADILDVSTDDIKPLLEELIEEDKVVYDPINHKYAKKVSKEEIERKLLELLEKRKKKIKTEKAIIYDELSRIFPQFSIDEVEFIDDTIRVKAHVLPDFSDFYTEKFIYVEGKDLEEIIRNFERQEDKIYKLAGFEKAKIEKEIEDMLMRKREIKAPPESKMAEIIEAAKTRVMSFEEMCDACLKWGTQTKIACPTCEALARVTPEETRVIGHLKSWDDVYCCPVCHRLFSKDLHLLWYPPTPPR